MPGTDEHGIAAWRVRLLLPDEGRPAGEDGRTTTSVFLLNSITAFTLRAMWSCEPFQSVLSRWISMLFRYKIAFS